MNKIFLQLFLLMIFLHNMEDKSKQQKTAEQLKELCKKPLRKEIKESIEKKIKGTEKPFNK